MSAFRPRTPARRRAELRLAGLVALVGVLLPGCSSIGGQASGGYKVTAYFSKALSLYHQSDVRVLGLSVGKVSAVVTEGNRVRVDMTVRDRVRLPVGVEAAIMPQSLIGERFVQLYPAWVDGVPVEARPSVIPLERTTVPVEPDEALAALKHLLDDLDPNATGRLVTNLSQDLAGNGQHLNNALAGLATLATTLASKHDDLAGLVDNFDAFTTALSTHEQQLGTVMEEFAQLSSLLAQEREQVAGLVHNLATVSGDALDLISKHGARLQNDIQTLAQLLATVDANIGHVSEILSAGPSLVAGANLDSKSGLIAAYNHKFHRIDLRDELSPAVAQFLGALGIGGTTVCLPVDVACSPKAAAGAAAGSVPAAAPAPAVPATAPPTAPPATAAPTTAPPATAPPTTAPVLPLTPIDGLISLLSSAGTTPVQPAAYGLSQAGPRPKPSSGSFRWLARAAHEALGLLW